MVRQPKEARTLGRAAHQKMALSRKKKKDKELCHLARGQTNPSFVPSWATKTRPADVSQQHQMPFQNRDSFHVFGHRREVLPSMWVELGTVWNSC